ncbi:hypothetical protein TWF506_011484 [Arthrobotrys conoides]|uniref:Ankyrin repeat protein n=1 Tax=Arthrobotrys conoides TaxID=74498 RepID=A0AAN8PB91_9PEZI
MRHTDFCRLVFRRDKFRIDVVPRRSHVHFLEECSTTSLTLAIEYGRRDIFRLIVERDDTIDQLENGNPYLGDSALSTDEDSALELAYYKDRGLFELVKQGEYSERPGRRHMGPDNFRLWYLSWSANVKHHDTYFGEKLMERERKDHGELWWSKKRDGVYYRPLSYSPLFYAVKLSWIAMFEILLKGNAPLNNGGYLSFKTTRTSTNSNPNQKIPGIKKEPVARIGELAMANMAAFQMIQPNIDLRSPRELIKTWLEHVERVPDSLIRAVILNKAELVPGDKRRAKIDEFWSDLENSGEKFGQGFFSRRRLVGDIPIISSEWHGRRHVDKRMVGVLQLAILYADMKAVEGILKLRMPLTPITWWPTYYIVGSFDPWSWTLTRIYRLKARNPKHRDLQTLEKIANLLDAAGYGLSSLEKDGF